MQEKTKVLIMTTSNTYLYSEDLQTQIYSQANSKEYPSWALYDPAHEKLWLMTDNGGKTIERYAVSDTELTLEASITISIISFFRNGVCVDNDGNLYYLDSSRVDNGTMHIGKILIDGTSEEFYKSFSPYTTDGNKDSTYGSALVFNPDKNELICIYNGWDENTSDLPSSTGHYYTHATFSLDCETINYHGHAFFAYGVGLAYTIYCNSPACVLNSYSKGSFKWVEYNPVTKRLNMVINRVSSAGGTYIPLLYDFDLETSSTMITRGFKVVDPSIINSNTISPIENATLNVSKSSGDIFVYSGDVNYACKFSANLKHKETKSLMLTSAYELKYSAFNDITEDTYFSYADYGVSRYGKDLTLKNSIGSIDGNYVKAIEVIPKTNESAVNTIMPADIVYPANEDSIVSTTPTICFKVNKNPSGWTQQFRLVVATSQNEIYEGADYDSYYRKFDSWANGDAYNSDCNWQYSSDYVIGDDPDSTGTWTNLGSDDGLQSGGVNGTNGINGNAGEFYVKMKIPTANALDTNDSDEFYFNIYSYSKYV